MHALLIEDDPDLSALLPGVPAEQGIPPRRPTSHREDMRLFLSASAVCLVACSASIDAQVAPLTRIAAVQTAIERGPRLAVARADTAVALAQLLTARAVPNPVLSTSYSKSTPQYHVTAELPLDYLWVRGTRIQSAQAARTAAQFRYQFNLALLLLDVDTTYTRALAAVELARLSQRTARDADSLRLIAIARRDAGDASDLDVELATVNAGQQANVAAGDSLAVVSTALDLQSTIGIGGPQVTVIPVDSLTMPPDSAYLPGTPLPVAAATAQLEAATLAARVQRRSLWNTTAIIFGFEAHDPTGSESGILPTAGIALPLPFFDRNRGPIAQAEAERARAAAELELARVDAQTRIARATRERANALAKVGRDRLLVVSANRVASMSLTAYREGASSLPNVLEAQRNAREILAQYVQDLAAAWIATAILRAYTIPPSSTAQR